MCMKPLTGVRRLTYGDRMTWQSGPGLTIDEHGRVVVKAYTVAHIETGFQAVALKPLTPAEVSFKCRDVIEAESLPELLMLIAAEAIKRDLILRAWELGQARLAAMREAAEEQA